VSNLALCQSAGRRKLRGQALVGALATVIVLGLLAYWNDQALLMFYVSFSTHHFS
jgi:hypothetical protein